MEQFPEIAEERHQSEMRSARLHHAVLQTVINHAAENDISTEEIVMGLINVAGYWQTKAVRDKLLEKRTK